MIQTERFELQIVSDLGDNYNENSYFTVLPFKFGADFIENGCDNGGIKSSQKTTKT